MANISNINNVLRTGSTGIGINCDPEFTLDVERSSASAVLSLNSVGGSGAEYLIFSGTDGSLTFNKRYVGDRLYIASGGNIGIGTSSPAQKVEIAGGYLKFSGGDYGIQGSASLTYNAVSDHYFQASGSTKVTIKADGKVGIGTTSPASLLEIYGGGNTLRMDSAGNTSKTFLMRNVNTATAEIKTDGNLDINIEDANRTMRFLNGNTERMRITSGGNVGIGTTSPSYKLHVSGTGGTRMSVTNTDTNWAAVQIQASGNQADYIFFKDDTEERARITALDTNDLVFSNTDSVTERMRITSAGNVGIGTTSPSYKLDVNGTLRMTSSYHQNVNFTNTPTFQIGTDTYSSGFFVYDSTAAQYRMVVKSSTGNVGIGTVSPTAKLEIVGSNGTNIFRGNFGGSADIFMGFDNANPYLTLQDNSNVTTHLFQSNVDNYIVGSNIGIGTTSPAAITGNVSAITLGGANGSVSGGVMYQFNGNNAAAHYYESSNFRYQNVGNYDHTFYTSNTTQRFQINTNGWSYFNNQGTGGGIEINGTSGKYLDIYCNASIAAFSTNASNYYFNTNVGIGTTSPTSKLTVKGVITAGDSSTDAVIRRQHQTFSTMKPGPSSGGSVDMMFVDHTNALDITVMAYINTSNVATGKGYLVTAYGSAVGGLSNTRFAGVISALSISYVNTGGSENYVLRVTCTYSGATAPTISVTASGQSTSQLRQAI